MVTIRKLLRHLSGNAIALLIAYVLLLQGVIAGVAHGAMAGAPADTFGILCSASGQSGAVPSPDAPDSHDVACPCATLCQVSGHTVPVMLGAGLDVTPPAPAVARVAFAPRADIGARDPPRRLPQARAPPFFSAG